MCLIHNHIGVKVEFSHQIIKKEEERKTNKKQRTSFLFSPAAGIGFNISD